jgi:hypothetical protein
MKAIKKIIVVITGLVIVSCTPAPEPPMAHPHPRMNECLSVYDHILDVHVQEAEEEDYPETGPSDEEADNALTNLRMEFHSNGTEKQFFVYCRDELREEQAKCMLHASSVSQITLCAKNGKR